MASKGLILKEARKNVNLTLRQVEDMTGISNAYLSQLENDKIKNPSGNTLFKLSKLYKIPLRAVINDNDSNELDPSLTSFMRNVAFSAKDLTDQEKTEVLNYLNYIRSKKG